MPQHQNSSTQSVALSALKTLLVLLALVFTAFDLLEALCGKVEVRAHSHFFYSILFLICAAVLHLVQKNRTMRNEKRADERVRSARREYGFPSVPQSPDADVEDWG